MKLGKIGSGQMICYVIHFLAMESGMHRRGKDNPHGLWLRMC